MPAKLLRFLVLAIMLVLLSLAVAMFGAYRGLEVFKSQGSQSFALRYDWLHANLHGQIKIQGVDVRLYALKRDIKLDSLTIDYGHYLNLLLHLPDLLQASLAGVTQAHLAKATLALNGIDPEQWLAAEYGDAWLLPAGLYTCGDKNRVDAEVLQRMGIANLQADLLFTWPEQARRDLGDFNLRLDMRELGVFEVDIGGLGLASSKAENRPWEQLALTRLAVRYSDSGYIRRLSNYCELQSEQSRQARSVAAAAMWQQALKQAGIELNDEVRDGYRDYFLLGGELALSFELKTAQTFGQLLRRYDVNLFERYGIALALNGEALDNPSLVLDQQVFAPVVRLAPEPTSPPKARANQALWQAIELDDIASMQGKWLRVELNDDRRLEGYLEALDAQQFSLRQQSASGEVSFTLNRSDLRGLWLKKTRT